MDGSTNMIKRGSKPILLDGMEIHHEYADKTGRHHKSHSHGSNSIITETSQSFFSQTTGKKGQGLDMSLDQLKNYASAQGE